MVSALVWLVTMVRARRLYCAFISGVYVPVHGKLDVRRRIASLLDVSMGLDPDATGFENIYLRGIIDGLKPKVTRARVDDIAESTELGEYLKVPVRTYSSGMMLRLAFGISTGVEADLLIMDEWLSVGDAQFSAGAADRLENLVSKTGIVVIPSHGPQLIDRVCTRRIHLEHGKVISDEKIIRKDVTTQ